MPSVPAPRSKTELLQRARLEAHLSLGRAAFVRDARVLPIGVPIALAVAALAYTRASRERHDWRHLWRPRRSRNAALGVAGVALVGAVSLVYLEARLEWEAQRRAWRRLHDY